jgi:C4-dicarboxylate transporter DctM subunit
VADVSALGTFLIPQMERKGYDRDFATALTISTAIMAPIIPPSIIAVIYAWMADESVAAIFAAGYLPGLLVGLGMAVPVFVIARKRNYPKEKPPTAREFMVVLRNALPALMIPIIIMGGILFGLFTPTEAAAVAVVYALIVPPFFYHEPSWRELPRIFADSARLSGVIGLIIGLVGAFGWVLTYSKFPFVVAEWIGSIAPTWWLFMMLVIAGTAAGGRRGGHPSDTLRDGVRDRLRNRPHHPAGRPVPVRGHGDQRAANGKIDAAAGSVPVCHHRCPLRGRLHSGDHALVAQGIRLGEIDGK